jgi:hypothetical protein
MKDIWKVLGPPLGYCTYNVIGVKLPKIWHSSHGALYDT